MDGSEQTLIATDSGTCEPFTHPAVTAPERPYRLYRFLTELEDLLATEPNNTRRIQQIVPRVRQLLTSAYWLQLEFDPPTDKGWSVRFLYREYSFPLTVQMVTWAPGQRSTIHNHATWGVVALIGGQEKNRLWRRTPTASHPDQLEVTEEIILSPGDVIGFMPGAIHQVEPVGDEPTVSFNLYGPADRRSRYRFDPEQNTAEQF